MQNQDKITSFYNTHAASYAKRYLDELSDKHLDRIILREFAAVNNPQGIAVDLGCGPGQTTKFLYEHGLKNIVGIDISRAMISMAKSLHPEIPFVEASMLNMPFADMHFGSAIAFYAIVNLDYDQIESAFAEIARILKPQSEFLLCFHTGNATIHLDEFEDSPADVDFYLFDPERILDLLYAQGFETITAYERLPYPQEYPSKRAYLWMRKKGSV